VQSEFSYGYIDHTVLQGAINVAVDEVYNMARDGYGKDVAGFCSFARDTAGLVLQNVNADRMNNLWQLVNVYTSFNNFSELVIQNMLSMGCLRECVDFLASIESAFCSMISSTVFGNFLPLFQFWCTIEALDAVVINTSYTQGVYNIDLIRSQIEGFLDAFFTDNYLNFRACVSDILNDDYHLVSQYLQDVAYMTNDVYELNAIGLNKEILTNKIAAQNMFEGYFFTRITNIIYTFIHKKHEAGLGFDNVLLDKVAVFCNNYGFSAQLLTSKMYVDAYAAL
jgi:hypothetical protein